MPFQSPLKIVILASVIKCIIKIVINKYVVLFNLAPPKKMFVKLNSPLTASFLLPIENNRKLNHLAQIFH